MNEQSEHAERRCLDLGLHIPRHSVEHGALGRVLVQPHGTEERVVHFIGQPL